MLAQIAEEIHAPLIVLLKVTGEGGNSDYQDLGVAVDDDDPTDIGSGKSPPSCSRTGLEVLTRY